MIAGKNMILLFQATVTLHGKDASECTSAYGSEWSRPSNCASKTDKDTCQVNPKNIENYSNSKPISRLSFVSLTCVKFRVILEVH